MMLKSRAQCFVTEFLEAPQDRMVSISPEARDLFVAHTQSDECRLIEIEGKSGFWSRPVLGDQTAIKPYDFQRALFKVMCFLDISGPGSAMQSRAPG